MKSRLPVLSLIACLPLLLGAAGGIIRVEDFGNYWCGARINWTGGNPYDFARLLELQRTIEPEREKPQVPWGPPWSLAIVTPLIGLDFATARWSWLGLQALALAMSAALLWKAYRGPPEKHIASLLLCFSFFPNMVLLGLGQVSIANLVALAGFLFFLERRADFRAGLMSSLILVKPQVMILFALAVAVWVIQQRRWRLAAGGICGIVILSAIVLVPNPRVFSDYVDAMRNRPPTGDVTPTPAAILQLLAGGEFWPSLIPLGLGIGWLGFRYFSHRRHWDWLQETPGLTFACFLSSPHAWAYDLVILLVPLIRVAVNVVQGTRRTAVVFVAIHLLITAIAMTMNLWQCDESEFMWLAPSLLGAYLWFGRSFPPSRNNVQ